MSADRDSQRMVIAGASSLLGGELKSLLEESRFAGWDLRLVDEDLAAGTLTAAAGEPAVIQPVEEGTFERAHFVFFTGSPAFTERNFAAALAAGATVIDFSGKVWTKDLAVNPWFPKLDEFWGTSFMPGAPHYWAISAGGIAAISLSFGLRKLGLKRLSIVFFQPVSEAGRAGIEELESQTMQLLSFQSVGRSVFDAQIAFNLLERYGPATQQSLDGIRHALREEVSECLSNQGAVMPAIQVIQAPTFYGTVFSACAELDPGLADTDSINKACLEVGFSVMQELEGSPSNVSAAGETIIQVGIPRSDPLNHGTWWIWGAVDNFRLPAWNAIKLAEKLAV